MSAVNQATESLSIDETNKLRISLGLKPLDVTGEKSAPANKDATDKNDDYVQSQIQEDDALENWKREQQRAAEEQKHKEAELRLQKLRAERERKKLLQKKSLAELLEDEEGAEEEDALSWVKRTRSQVRKSVLSPSSTTKLQKPASTTSVDLSNNSTSPKNSTLEGVRIAHNTSQLSSPDGVYLTLRDANVLDNNGDVFESVSLVEQETTERNVKERLRQQSYVPYEDETTFNGSALLPQYSNEKNQGLSETVIGGNNIVLDSTQKINTANATQNSEALSLDTGEEKQITDYQSIKIKKSKRKKRKAVHQRTIDTVDEVDGSTTANEKEEQLTQEHKKFTVKDVNLNIKYRAFYNSSFVDDDDLQSALSTRRQQLQRKRALDGESVADQVMKLPSHLKIEHLDGTDSNPGLVLDATRTFVDALENKNVVVTSPEPMSHNNQTNEDGVPAAKLSINEKTADAFDTANEQNNGMDAEENAIEESLVSKGVGTVLNILKQKGVVKLQNDAYDRVRREQLYTQWVAKKRLLRAELEDKRQRELYAKRENEKWDKMVAELEMEQFQDYKPEINLRYVDEFGQELGPKEAYKYLLSHQFHGKGSGKAKTEKRLKKIEEIEKNERKPIF
ncbi:U4/U6 X U5 tri-snRNP complex subunit Snu66 [Schizosaccharomyces japonicus yFS275]|uniref:U4/U6 X U5 tri-snRNP complex subunit Snu66 n=1 Tax=Schizosaccharomyces japonicus (strain yFS275 / FY16936) TaxID=402676 RepID=B6K6U4_SCHJY|nr:U4/U6 X U5 tri-snRNP complex subunit Snu66 [Schizosaccharomyces japonicus yFS275]EEB09248.2 U4/U6 X U5 tri-snRNP complex subunit Snu66 [Schizosaccharomyces japonicus yFS275]